MATRPTSLTKRRREPTPKPTRPGTLTLRHRPPLASGRQNVLPRSR